VIAAPMIPCSRSKGEHIDFRGLNNRACCDDGALPELSKDGSAELDR